ncbi:MAG TPA: hypothetical protein VHG51_05915, partial [Longimicrobiaceae bacterium]|nr:hypothetical protein [Longimicrobiaceae bacterium]
MRTALATLLAATLATLAAPAAAQISVVSATVNERQARPGETYAGTILIRNSGPEPHEAKLYQTDYRFFADGRTLFETAGSRPRSNAGWITLSPSRVVVPPGGEATVRYTVAVPATGEASGSYWSTVMVEGVGRDSPEASGGRPARVQVGLRTTVRYAVQVATHLAGGTTMVDFAGVAVASPPEGGRALELDVLNPGERAYRLDLSVELFDALGAPAGKLSSRRGLLYPGSSLRQSFGLPALPPGSYRALVIADTGGD